MEEKGDAGADRGEGGLSGWPADQAEYAFWFVPAGNGQWYAVTSFRFGMHYQQDFLVYRTFSTEAAIAMMKIGEGE